MKLVPTVLMGSAVLASAVFASPALANSDGQQGSQPVVSVGLQTNTTYGDRTVGSSLHVEGTAWTRKTYMLGVPTLPGMASGTITATQAKMLQRLVTSDTFAAEQNTLERIDCGTAPITSWTLRAGDITVSAPSCDGELPKAPRTFAKVVDFLIQATASTE